MNKHNKKEQIFTKDSIYSPKASGAEQMAETNTTKVKGPRHTICCLFKKPILVFASMNPKNNVPVLLFQAIFRHRNCFMLPLAMDGKDGHGFVKTLPQRFQVLMLCQQNHQTIIMVSAP